MSSVPPRVLIADDDRLVRSLLRGALEEVGITVSEAEDGRAALDALRSSPPDVLLLDLVMPHVDGFQVLARLRETGPALPAGTPSARPLQIIVLTGRGGHDTLTRALAAGAHDYIAKPFHLEEVIARTQAHLRIVSVARQLEQRRRDGETLVAIGQRLSSRLDLQSILHEVTTLVADTLATERCSIVLQDPQDPLQARVVAASDVAGLTDQPIDLARYPEIHHVMEHRAPLVVGDVTLDPLLEPVKAHLAGLPVRCVALFPLLEAGRCFGVLFLRSHRPREELTERELQIGTIVANSAAIAISNARLFAAVKADAARSSHAAAVVEDRLRRVQRYADFFESAADALCVARPSGRLIYMNRRAVQLTGLTRGEAAGRPLGVVLGAVDPAAAEALFGRYREGRFEPADLPIRGGRLLCLSAAALPEDEALSVTVRDVTEERRNAKLAAVAELAGAAAHELNQPLTSVSAYAELLERLCDDPKLKHAARVIQEQAGRMADLVRRIGRITRYETKPYVGDTRILDLDAAADAEGEAQSP